jgi:DNA polymerase III subunit delta
LILQNLDDLESKLSKGEFRPVYLILGPEQYQCRQAISLLKRKALTPEAQAFDYAEFTAGENRVDEIMEAANTFPMISKRKVVLVNEVENFEESEQESLLESIQGLSRRTTLILAADELDHRRKFFKTLREEACLAEFPRLKGTALEKWAGDYVRNQGYTISFASTRKVVELAGPDLQNLAMELDKLLLFAGKSGEVPDSSVDDLLQGSRQQTVFKLVDAVGQRNRTGALRSLSNLLNMGEHPLYIVTMMARHCRQVMIAQEYLLRGSPANEIASAAQIPPFMLDQFLRQARSADPASIQQMFTKLAEIDRRLKSSAGDGRILLEGLICALV